MAPRLILSTIARVEIALAVLIVVLVAIGFGIHETDDVWALGLSTMILAVLPIAALLLNKSNANYRTILAAVLIASWLPVVWWALVYA